MTVPDPRELLPLKPFVFHILVALLDGERHGWALLRALEARDGGRVLPGQLYRQLDAMLAESLIEEREVQPKVERGDGVGGAAPRRFFRLTPFGRRVARAEAQRLAGLVDELRTKRLLGERGRS